MALPIMTDEQREDYRLKTAQKIQGMKENAKDFIDPASCDRNLWTELAALYKIKLPAYYYPNEPKYMRKYVNKLNLNIDILRDTFGDSWSYTDYKKLNPNKGLIWFVGCLLEIVSDGLNYGR